MLKDSKQLFSDVKLKSIFVPLKLNEAKIAVVLGVCTTELLRKRECI